MTNAEKYLKEGITEEDIEKIAKAIDTFYQNNIGLLPIAIQQFFNELQKPTLTEDERVILRNIKNNDFEKYIGRGDSSRENTPTYYNLYLRGDDESKAYAIGTIYNHLFSFIKERRRI